MRQNQAIMTRALALYSSAGHHSPALAMYGSAGHHKIGYAGGGHSVAYSDCCGVVIDTYTYLALMSFIFLATYFLWVAITMNVMAGRRRKRTTSDHLFDVYWAGMKQF